MAKYKSTDHFLLLEGDARIHYEEPAKGNALILKEVLGSSQNSVENILHSSFKSPVEVYICASQKEFNEYVFLSKNVRGAVYWGKLFLSPGAFNRGSLVELISHELTHYLFYTHLGERAHMEGIPLWFREGIAVYVANGGARYTEGKGVYSVMNQTEREAYLLGEADHWFVANNPASAVNKDGTVNWLFYRAGALFVHFLHDSNSERFDRLIQLLLSGTKFSEAIQLSYEKTAESLRKEFTLYLVTYNAQPKLGQ